jgi:hypothetical protein
MLHFFWVLVERASFENMLVPPTRDPSLFLLGVQAVLESAAVAGVSPIAAQDQPRDFAHMTISKLARQ